MKKIIICLFIVIAANASAQQARIVKLDELKTLIENRSDNIQVINFWATWCGPCVKELPLFEKLTAEQKPGLKVTLVSLDMDLDPNPEKVHKFVARKKLQSSVLILDEKNPNEWISSIDKEWSGALPATIVINQKTGERRFIGKELHPGDLEKLIAEVQ